MFWGVLSPPFYIESPLFMTSSDPKKERMSVFAQVKCSAAKAVAVLFPDKTWFPTTWGTLARSALPSPLRFENILLQMTSTEIDIKWGRGLDFVKNITKGTTDLSGECSWQRNYKNEVQKKLIPSFEKRNSANCISTLTSCCQALSFSQSIVNTQYSLPCQHQK